MLKLKRKKTDTAEITDKLLTAVVSLYLYMARTARLKGEEINFIDRILHSMFGNDIPLFKIEQARLQVLSIRDAANFLNLHLSPADRTKIILSLISLAYHDRNKIHVLGSLEIVELTDLLRLDVSLLDAIYDVFEGKTSVIDLPLDTSANSSGMLHNSMLWAASGGDYLYHGAVPSAKLLFIMIESLVLLYPDLPEGSPPCQIMEGECKRSLEPKRFHFVKDNTLIMLPAQTGEIAMNTDKLWMLYNLGVSPRNIHFPEDKELKLSYANRCFYLEKHIKNSPRVELALDDLPSDKSPLTLLQILTRDYSETEAIFENADYYLCSDKQGLYLQPESCSGALLHFHRSEAGGLQVESTATTEIFLNRIPLTGKQPFVINQDIISLSGYNYLINRNWELIEIPVQMNELSVAEISHSFAEGNTALSSISFKVPKGSMMAIMGPSGSGKTTLLQVLLGDVKATHSKIYIDGLDFSANFSFYQKHIGYVPQDDLLFPNLTVFENLLYRIRLALPNLKNKAEINTRIENLLHSVGLFEQRHMIVGDAMNKKLSGGQRRRLNIALELVLNPMIIILDEPTSGLSSKDSENIAEFLCELKEQNKMILCTIHQPNATVFNAFDHVLLLDKGGKQVYFGSSAEVFDYFAEELNNSGDRHNFLITKRNLQMPDYFYDLIETQDRSGNRKFPPDYWERKYRNHRFRKAMDTELLTNNSTTDQPRTKAKKQSLWNNLHSMAYLIKRNFVNKSRSKINLLMTLLVAPLLSALTAFVLRGVPEGQPYTFYHNNNSWLFGFISIIIFIFIGLANSIDDILGEKRSLIRELKLSIPAINQLLAKHLVLLIMTLVQVFLYYHISSLVLGLRGYALPHMLFLLLSGITGYSFGLLFSSIIKDRSAIINILPLVIIPQIMFSGAVIRFSDMNASLRLNRSSEIPEFCQIIPSRWLYEGWMIASGSLSSVQIHKERFVRSAKDTSLSYESYMQTVDKYNAYTLSHPESHYSNSLIKQATSIAHGEYLNKQRNTFLSPKLMLFGKERSTLWLDIAMSMLIIAACGFISWLRLKYYFK